MRLGVDRLDRHEILEKTRLILQDLQELLNPLSAKKSVSPKWKWLYSSVRVAFRFRCPL